MKRALLLTYYVPPRAAIASVRAGQLLDALQQNGWTASVVTPDFDDTSFGSHVVTTGVLDFKAPVRRLLGVKQGATTHQHLGAERGAVAASSSLKHRAIRLGYELTEFANRRFGWLSHGPRAIAELLQRERFDAVISTSPPETTHMVAARVHGNIPWIADLRDPWVRNDTLRGPAALTMMDRALEPRAFRSASALMTVSEPLAAQLRERHPDKPVYSVPNAFSAAEWNGVPFARSDRMRIVYAGQLYSGRRDPRPLLEAIAYLIREQLVHPDELSVDFYGHPAPWLDETIAAFGLRRCVKQHGTRSRAEILTIEREASRLLLLLWDDPGERGTYTGKLFEYLGARRPILVCGGPNESVVDDVLRSTGAGVRHRSQHGLRDDVLAAVKAWRAGVAEIVPEAAVAPYEVQTLTTKVGEILERCTQSRVHSLR